MKYSPMIESVCEFDMEEFSDKIWGVIGAETEENRVAILVEIS